MGIEECYLHEVGADLHVVDGYDPYRIGKGDEAVLLHLGGS